MVYAAWGHESGQRSEEEVRTGDGGGKINDAFITRGGKEGRRARCARRRIHKRSLSLSESGSREVRNGEGGREDDRAAEPRFSGAKVVIKAFSLARESEEGERGDIKTEVREGERERWLDRQPHLKEGRGNEMNQAAKEGPQGGLAM